MITRLVEKSPELLPLDDIDEGGRWRRAYSRSLPFAVVLMLLLAAAVVWITVGGHSAQQLPGQPPAHPHASSSTPPKPTDRDLTVPTLTPTVTWQNYQGVSVPFSGSAGPLAVQGPVAADYAHTPLGALIAAWQIDVRMLVAPGNGWKQVTAQQVLPGNGRDAWVAQRSTANDAAPGSGYGQLAGFRFVTYSPQLAVIEFAVRFNDNSLQMTTLTVAWSTDWRLQLQPDGSDSPTAQPIATLANFVPFGDGGTD